MKFVYLLLGAFLLFCTMLQAQDTAHSPANSQMPSTAPTAPPRVAPGSVIPVQLTKTVDAKKAKSGEIVEAKVTQDMKSNSGNVIVAKDTKMVGHVTQAQPHTKQQDSELGIAFDHAVMTNGDSVALPMSIQAIIVPQTSNPAANPSDSSGTGNENPAGASAGGSGRGAPSGGSPSRMPSPSSAGDQSGAQGGSSGTPPITANTKGVVGIKDINLAAPTSPNQGSLLTSEKKNVKLDSGTLMLLRVNQ